MTDLDDLLNEDEEIEEGTLEEEEGDGLEGLFDEDEGVEDDDEIEAPPPIPAKGKKKASKKKASKKKASKKKAAKKPAEEEEEDDGLGGLFDDGEEEAPKRKKKASKKKASVEKSSTEPEQSKRKKKASKKKATRKPRANADPLGALQSELSSIAGDSEDKAQIAQLKAELRSAKALSTKLNRFAKKAASVAAGQDALVEKLEAKLASKTE